MVVVKTWEQFRLRFESKARITLLLGGFFVVFIGILLFWISEDNTTRIRMIIAIILGILLIFLGYFSLKKFNRQYSHSKVWYGDGQDFSPSTIRNEQKREKGSS